MPKVDVIHFTGLHPQNGGVQVDGKVSHDLVLKQEREFAGRLLVFTKATRLTMSAARWSEVLTMPWSDILKELDYMAGTIPSSWEFVDVTFSLLDVSRACAQQITRTRFTPMDMDVYGSYAMQSMRVEEMEPTFHVNPELGHMSKSFMQNTHAGMVASYKQALDLGISQQDARGLLPLDTHCNLVVKFNLRQLVDMLRTRDQSLRVQGEYGEVAHQMKEQVLAIWPWSETFFQPKDAKSIGMIQEVAEELKTLSDMTLEQEDRKTIKDLAVTLAKAADLLKK